MRGILVRRACKQRGLRLPDFETSSGFIGVLVILRPGTEVFS
jgi:hypothetical protein